MIQPFAAESRNFRLPGGRSSVVFATRRSRDAGMEVAGTSESVGLRVRKCSIPLRGLFCPAREQQRETFPDRRHEPSSRNSRSGRSSLRVGRRSSPRLEKCIRVWRSQRYFLPALPWERALEHSRMVFVNRLKQSAETLIQ